MEKKMTFTVDRTSVTEGDIVEVRWDCNGSERVELSIDNGYKATVLPLEIEGTKRFRLNRSKGRTRLTITAYVQGKPCSKTIKVKVKEIPVTHADTVDGKGNPVGAIGRWWHRTAPKLRTGVNHYRQSVSELPPEKRLARRMLLILLVILIAARFAPVLFLLLMMVLCGYLVWILLKK